MLQKLFKSTASEAPQREKPAAQQADKPALAKRAPVKLSPVPLGRALLEPGGLDRVVDDHGPEKTLIALGMLADKPCLQHHKTRQVSIATLALHDADAVRRRFIDAGYAARVARLIRRIPWDGPRAAVLPGLAGPLAAAGLGSSVAQILGDLSPGLRLGVLEAGVPPRPGDAPDPSNTVTELIRAGQGDALLQMTSKFKTRHTAHIFGRPDVRAALDAAANEGALSETIPPSRGTIPPPGPESTVDFAHHFALAAFAPPSSSGFSFDEEPLSSRGTPTEAPSAAVPQDDGALLCKLLLTQGGFETLIDQEGAENTLGLLLILNRMRAPGERALPAAVLALQHTDVIERRILGAEDGTASGNKPRAPSEAGDTLLQLLHEIDDDGALADVLVPLAKPLIEAGYGADTALILHMLSPEKRFEVFSPIDGAAPALARAGQGAAVFDLTSDFNTTDLRILFARPGLQKALRETGHGEALDGTLKFLGLEDATASTPANSGTRLTRRARRAAEKAAQNGESAPTAAPTTRRAVGLTPG